MNNFPSLPLFSKITKGGLIARQGTFRENIIRTIYTQIIIFYYLVLTPDLIIIYPSKVKLVAGKKNDPIHYFTPPPFPSYWKNKLTNK